MTADQAALEALRREIYARPSDEALRAYQTALTEQAIAEVQQVQQVTDTRLARGARRRRILLGSVGGSAALITCALLGRAVAEGAHVSAVVAQAAHTTPFATCGIVSPQPGLVRNALTDGVTPSLNDLSWLRGSILTNTYALRMPDRAGERGVSEGTKEISLKQLGHLRAGDYIRVSVVALDSAVMWTVTAADGRPWGQCGSPQRGEAATAVLRLQGRPPFTVTIATRPDARFAYFSEVPESPMS